MHVPGMNKFGIYLCVCVLFSRYFVLTAAGVKAQYDKVLKVLTNEKRGGLTMLLFDIRLFSL